MSIGCMMYSHLQSMFFTNKGYTGVRSGYCELTQFDEEVARGLKDNISQLHSQVFSDEAYNRVLEEATNKIIESFEFVHFK